jgi:septal ring factor EnvC (AmiA/AmiB activator)
MSEDDTKTTAESELRGAELRENVALTDARRAEEEVAKAHAETEAAEQKEEKLSRKEQRLREKAERVHAEADRQRAQAAAAAPAPEPTPEPATFVTGDAPSATQRPEVLIGATFAGSFIVARILKRIFD